MADNRSDQMTASEQSLDGEAPPEKTHADVKRQSGRPPVRPPYEQYLRVSKVSK